VRKRREVRRDPDAIMLNCFMCNRAYQMGPHIYQGRAIGPWEIDVCHICYEGNRDGIVPTQWPHLINHLRSKVIKPKLNAKGWIDWPV
jgi:hypothetical protein